MIPQPFWNILQAKCLNIHKMSDIWKNNENHDSTDGWRSHEATSTPKANEKTATEFDGWKHKHYCEFMNIEAGWTLWAGNKVITHLLLRNKFLKQYSVVVFRI